MDYVSWYHEKYVGTKVGFRTGQLISAVEIVDATYEECRDDRSDVSVLLRGRYIDDWVMVEDERIVWKLPEVSRLYLDSNGKLFCVQRNIQHQWRYGFRQRMVSKMTIANGTWAQVEDGNVIEDMYTDRQTGADQLITPYLGESGGRLYTTSGMIGFWRNEGVLLLEDCAEEFLPQLAKEGVNVHGYVKPSENSDEVPHLYGSGSGTGARKKSEWDSILGL